MCPRPKGWGAAQVIGSAFVGGLAAIVFVALFDPGQQTIDLDGLVFSSGALVAAGLHLLSYQLRGRQLGPFKPFRTKRHGRRDR